VTSPIRLGIRIALAFGMLLVFGAAAAASADSVFPGAARAGHNGASDTQSLSMPTGGLTPGDTVRGRHVIANGEGQTIRYSLSSVSNDDDRKGVRNVIQATIRTADLASGDAATCEAFDGQTLYDGPLGAAAAGFGDVAMGGQAGDRVLAPGQSETLCFEITLPGATGNEYQGATTATAWTISTEQQAGNP
jgi:hypothetical protein